MKISDGSIQKVLQMSPKLENLEEHGDYLRGLLAEDPSLRWRQLREAIKAKGVDLIAVHSVNDPHVLNAWNKQQGSEEIEIIADWNADFAKALGVDADMSKTGLGIRAKRYALIVKNGVVTYFGEGDLDVSGAEAILEAL